ncbi:MAG: hypothetical protein A2064_12355 [Spirochaetes bacterium GWB1_66_5]|nr:MAG: hypothetical protein A2064_12355 [Spirochaetes bacterium GWB1_66_5]
MSRAPARSYRSFAFKGASFRIACPLFGLATREIRRQRNLLEQYLRRQPEFRTALAPLALLPGAPQVAVRMQAAAAVTGVGPMAAVAGAMAQLAAEAALAAGAGEAIVENGGDIYLDSPEAVLIALYAGPGALSGRLALEIQPAEMPLAVCSSSGRLGHSFSFGDCDLATVVARDAALADAAATLAGNLVRRESDLPRALERVAGLPGVAGLLLVKGEKVGLAGRLPRLVGHADERFDLKITRGSAGLLP